MCMTEQTERERERFDFLSLFFSAFFNILIILISHAPPLRMPQPLRDRDRSAAEGRVSFN